jgi:crotonobetainyl-CoA:carnitine CoA-transferase CaiB-like acyl-CoA transferase
MAPVLEGLKVLDLSRGLAGSLATMYLCDQGAEVIKVEPPGGDPTRTYGGSYVWDRGKKSLTLNLKASEGKNVFKQLLRDADVLIETFKPGTMQRLGLDYEALKSSCPRLIYCSITGYGRKSASRDRPAYDALVQARLGMHFEQPSYRKGPDGKYLIGVPIFLYVPLPSYGAMFLATTGIGAALHAREVTGKGQWVETSLAQGSMMWATQIRYQVQNEPPNFLTVPKESGRASLYQCADGQWVHLMQVRDSNLVMYDLLDVPPEGRDVPGIRLTPEERTRRRPYIEAAFKKFSRDKILQLLQPAGVPVVPVQPTVAAYSTPQVLHNGMVVEVYDPDLGPIKMMGIPYYLEKHPATVRGPRPKVGQHTEEVLRDTGYTSEAIEQLRSAKVI